MGAIAVSAAHEVQGPVDPTRLDLLPKRIQGGAQTGTNALEKWLSVREAHVRRAVLPFKDHVAGPDGVAGQVEASGKVVKRARGNNAQRKRRADQTCIRNSNRLWVSRWGCESLSQLRRRGPAYPQPGKVPQFLFGPFSFVNNDSQCCEQALGGSIISAPSTSLSVTRLKQSVAHPKPGRTSEPRPGATALTCEGPQMNPNRLIGALGQPGITRADRGNILDLATSMGSGPSITPKEKGKE